MSEPITQRQLVAAAYAMEEEIWIRCLRNPSYWVSNFGRLRKDSRRGFRPLKPIKQTTGYYHIGITIAGRQTQNNVHRVVYEAFNGAIPPGLVINHRDANKGNNRLTNLELCTYRENFRHALRSGRLSNKLRPWQADQMRERYLAGASVVELAKQFGISRQHVYYIGNGLSWRLA